MDPNLPGIVYSPQILLLSEFSNSNYECGCDHCKIINHLRLLVKWFRKLKLVVVCAQVSHQ